MTTRDAIENVVIVGVIFGVIGCYMDHYRRQSLSAPMKEASYAWGLSLVNIPRRSQFPDRGAYLNALVDATQQYISGHEQAQKRLQLLGRQAKISGSKGKKLFEEYLEYCIRQLELERKLAEVKALMELRGSSRSLEIESLNLSADLERVEKAGKEAYVKLRARRDFWRDRISWLKRKIGR